MAKTSDSRSPAQQPVPRMQWALDNIFLLLLVGLTIPTVIYLGWGLVSILSVPPFPR